jgi:hypothetical protein
MIHARPDYQHIQDNTGKIPDNEPVFLIRAQDTLAAQALHLYADLAEENGASDTFVLSVREHAAKMEEWQPKKLPDLPSDSPSTVAVDGAQG